MSTLYKLPSLQYTNEKGNQSLKNQIALLQRKLLKANPYERERLESLLNQVQEHQFQYELILHIEQHASLERQQKLFAEARSKMMYSMK